MAGALTSRAQRVLVAAVVIVGLAIAGTGVALIKHRSPGKHASHRSATAAVHRAGQIGSTATRAGVRVTALGFDDPAQGLEVPAPAGDRWVSAEVRTCVASGHQGLQTGWFQFSVADAAGDRFPGIAWGNGGPAGLSSLPSIYPEFQVVEPGSCVSGWLLVPVPQAVKVVDLIHVGADGVQTGMWSLVG